MAKSVNGRPAGSTKEKSVEGSKEVEARAEALTYVNGTIDPFTVVYPNLKKRKGNSRKRRRSESDDAASLAESAADADADADDLAFIVRPQSIWEGLRRYNSFVGTPLPAGLI